MTAIEIHIDKQGSAVILLPMQETIQIASVGPAGLAAAITLARTGRGETGCNAAMPGKRC